MNKLSTEERVRVVACLVEGNSIRATVRMTGFSKNTVVKLLVELGAACSEYQDKVFRNLNLNRLQCDEIWQFVGCKEKKATPKLKRKGWGDVWTWTALDAETKLVPCWYVGSRDAYAAFHFMHDHARNGGWRIGSRLEFGRNCRAFEFKLTHYRSASAFDIRPRRRDTPDNSSTP